MSKAILYLLLFQIITGLLSPALALLQDHPLEETIAFVNTEKDNEMDEEELDKTLDFVVSLIEKKPTVCSSQKFFWQSNSYRYPFIKRLSAPPEAII